MPSHMPHEGHMSDNTLGKLQREFLVHLREENTTAAVSAVTEGGLLTPVQRLGIYRHAYGARLLEVLQDVFERTWAYLGDEGFASAVAAFIHHHPPGASTLQGFGAGFPDWLALGYANDPEIAEVARIDWMLRTAFDAADAEPVDVQSLGRIGAEDWARVTFRLHPSTALTPIQYNAASIWAALDQSTTPPAPEALTEETWLLVWRRAHQPHYLTVDALEAALMRDMLQGAGFASACAMAADAYPDAEIATRAGVALRRWVDNGLIVAIEAGA